MPQVSSHLIIDSQLPSHGDQISSLPGECRAKNHLKVERAEVEPPHSLADLLAFRDWTVSLCLGPQEFLFPLLPAHLPQLLLIL